MTSYAILHQKEVVKYISFDTSPPPPFYEEVEYGNGEKGQEVEEDFLAIRLYRKTFHSLQVYYSLKEKTYYYLRFHTSPWYVEVRQIEEDGEVFQKTLPLSEFIKSKYYSTKFRTFKLYLRLQEG